MLFGGDCADHMLGSLVTFAPVAVMRTKLLWEIHADITLCFVIDSVLVAMSLQAQSVWCFCTPRSCSFSLL